MFPELNSIRIRRQQLGIKQNKLAELAGASQSLIAKLEKGKIEPSYNVVIRIFRALDSLEHKNEKKCGEIMTKKLIFIRKGDKVEKASDLMKKNSIDQIPVLQSGVIIGSISESLIFNKIMESSKKAILEKKVEEIMKEPFPIVNADMPISLALPILKAEDAIIVSENSKFVGIITRANLI